VKRLNEMGVARVVPMSQTVEERIAIGSSANPRSVLL
jgi:hypothetical protein